MYLDSNVDLSGVQHMTSAATWFVIVPSTGFTNMALGQHLQAQNIVVGFTIIYI